MSEILVVLSADLQSDVEKELEVSDPPPEQAVASLKGEPKEKEKETNA
jgi:hypothetical protein